MKRAILPGVGLCKEIESSSDRFTAILTRQWSLVLVLSLYWYQGAQKIDAVQHLNVCRFPDGGYNLDFSAYGRGATSRSTPRLQMLAGCPGRPPSQLPAHTKGLF